MSQAQNDLKAAAGGSGDRAWACPTSGPSTLAEEGMPAPLPDRVDRLLRTAMQTRPELERSAPAGERRASASPRRSTLSTTRASEWSGPAGFVPAAYETVPGRYGAIGVNVNIPIFNGGLFKARQTEAELKAKAADAEHHRSGKPRGARCPGGLPQCHYGLRPDGSDASSCCSRRNWRSTWHRPATIWAWASSSN